MQKALANIEKAAQLGLNNNELNSNLALANLANGNVAKAQQYAAAADAKTKALIRLLRVTIALRLQPCQVTTLPSLRL